MAVVRSHLWLGLWASAAVACGGPEHVRQDDDLQVRLVAEAASGGERTAAWSSQEPLALEHEVFVSARSVTGARIFIDPASRHPVLVIQLDAAGTRRLEAVTARYQPRRLAVVVGGRIAGAPAIRGTITGGRLVVGAASRDEAEEMRRLVAPP